MPKKTIKVSPGASVTEMTDENLIVSPEMFDADTGGIEAQFHANADISEGVSGSKPIDTLFENTSEAIVQNPRSVTTEPPEDEIPGMYPHRSY